MNKNSIFALLTRGASLHKCTESLATPLLRRRQEQVQQKELVAAKERQKEGSAADEGSPTPEQSRQKHGISVKGLESPPAPFLTFADELYPETEASHDGSEEGAQGRGLSRECPRGLPSWLLSRVGTLGYRQPTPIQMQAIPLLLKGHHVLASAPTGSGKTLAFLLPLIACLKAPKAAFGRLVVLSPTRELARQSLRAFERLTEGTGFKAAFPQTHVGGRYGAADAVFATPLSLLTLLKEEKLSLSDCQHLVLDEADRLLDSGFSPQIDAILSELKKTREAKRIHICLFSATLPPSVILLAESIAYGAVHLAVGRASAAAPQIVQELVFCSTEAGKLWALKTLRVERRLIPPCLIFVETQERASELLREMISEGMAVDLLHASKSKKQRDATVDAFRIGKIWFLICTDLVARGVDFKGVALVINFDLPPSTAVYIHRIGRTGRAGREGKALTFFTLDDVPRLRPIVQVMRKSPNSKIPPFLNLKLTKNLRVKGRRKIWAPQQPHGASRRPRKSIRPTAKITALKTKRRAWAVAASLAKKRKNVTQDANANPKMEATSTSDRTGSREEDRKGDLQKRSNTEQSKSPRKELRDEKGSANKSSRTKKRKRSVEGGAAAAKRKAVLV